MLKSKTRLVNHASLTTISLPQQKIIQNYTYFQQPESHVSKV